MNKKIFVGIGIVFILLTCFIGYQQYEIGELEKKVEENRSTQEQYNSHNDYMWSIQVDINQDILDIFELLV